MDDDGRETAIEARIEPGDAPGRRLISVPVGEGNHRVTIRLGGGSRPARLTVRAEDRRLMLPAFDVPAGERTERSFVVNTRTAALPPPPENAPGGQEVLLRTSDLASRNWDDRLTLELIGDAAVDAVRIAPADVPTVYLAGDSTVTDQPLGDYASWGGMLTALLGTDVAVANHARSGATLKSFATDLRLAKLLSDMRAGDWLFIQFGHNDQKRQWPQTYADPAVAYPAWLRVYIAEARARGAHPVIVTPPERRTFEGDRTRPTLSDHAAAARRVAEEEGVPLIDLNAASIAIYEALGPGRSPGAFADGGRDGTHHNDYGAWLMANAVAAGIRARIPALAPFVTAPSFDPRHPPQREDIDLPRSDDEAAARPEGS